MIRRQNGKHPVTHKYSNVKLRRIRCDYEAAVDLACAQRLFGFAVFHVLQLKHYPRIALLKVFEYRGQALRRKARARADANKAGLQTLERICLLLQSLVMAAQIFYIRQQHQPVRRKRQTAAAAAKQIEVPFVLKVGNHAADGRLSVSHRLGCLSYAAHLRDPDKCLVFMNCHDKYPNSENE